MKYRHKDCWIEGAKFLGNPMPEYKVSWSEPSKRWLCPAVNKQQVFVGDFLYRDSEGRVVVIPQMEFERNYEPHP